MTKEKQIANKIVAMLIKADLTPDLMLETIQIARERLAQMHMDDNTQRVNAYGSCAGTVTDFYKIMGELESKEFNLEQLTKFRDNLNKKQVPLRRSFEISVEGNVTKL